MLRQQYELNKRTTKPSIYQTYRIHQCGLCNSLGDNYGLPFRALTSYEVSLLSILITAQQESGATTTLRRCPLDLKMKPSINNELLGNFTSAVAVSLEKLQTLDNVKDAGDARFMARLLNWALNSVFPLAIQKLVEIKFDIIVLMQFPDLQSQTEREGKDATYPSAMVTAELFVKTAEIAHNLENKQALATIGKLYGTYIFLLDAFLDWSSDLSYGRYNPLAKFSRKVDDAFILSYEGIIWLSNQIQQIRKEIRNGLNQLHLYRYGDDIFELCCVPIDRFASRLETLNDRGQELNIKIKDRNKAYFSE